MVQACKIISGFQVLPLGLEENLACLFLLNFSIASHFIYCPICFEKNFLKRLKILQKQQLFLMQTSTIGSE